MGSNLRIKNWGKFQHYKDRRPPWIKLHVELLNDKKFTALSCASRGLLMQLWVLASETDGVIPNDIEEIKFRLRDGRIKQTDLNSLITKGFLNGCKHLLADAVPDARDRFLQETETYTTETEGEDARAKNKPSKRFIKPTKEEVKAYLKAKGHTHVNIDTFFNHYESNGWKVGKNKMVSWKATLNQWESREKPKQPTGPRWGLGEDEDND